LQGSKKIETKLIIFDQLNADGSFLALLIWAGEEVSLP
jgi:hypothetical protein